LTDAAPPRFAATVYVPAAALAASAAEIAGAGYRHLFRARRLAVGDRLRAVDGEGHAREAKVAAVGTSAARLELGAPLAIAEPALRLTLVVAAPRPERASWLVEKAAELGVAAVRWLRSAHAPRGLGTAAIARHRRIALAAMQQSGGARLAEITGPHEWDELARLLAAVGGCCALDPRGGPMPRFAAPGSAAAVVGPEGGWTEAERERLAALACDGWSLGPRVLRIETAALVAAGSLLQAAGPRCA